MYSINIKLEILSDEQNVLPSERRVVPKQIFGRFRAHLLALHDGFAQYSSTRATVYRTLQRGQRA